MSNKKQETLIVQFQKTLSVNEARKILASCGIEIDIKRILFDHLWKKRKVLMFPIESVYKYEIIKKLNGNTNVKHIEIPIMRYLPKIE